MAWKPTLKTVKVLVDQETELVQGWTVVIDDNQQRFINTVSLAYDNSTSPPAQTSSHGYIS